MSSESSVLGVAVVAGGGSVAASMLANTGVPVILGCSVGLVLLVLVAILAKKNMTK